MANKQFYLPSFIVNCSNIFTNFSELQKLTRKIKKANLNILN